MRRKVKLQGKVRPGFRKGIAGRRNFSSTVARDATVHPIRPKPLIYQQNGYTTVLTVFTNSDAGATASTVMTILTNSLIQSGLTRMFVNLSVVNVGRTMSAYRCLRYVIDMTFTSNSAKDVLVTVAHVPNSDYAPIAGAGAFQNIAGTLNSTTFLVPANTKSPCHIFKSFNYSLGQIVKGETWKIDDNYAGTTTTSGVFASPATNTFMYVVCSNVAGGNFAANESPTIVGTIRQEVMFYDPRT